MIDELKLVKETADGARAEETLDVVGAAFDTLEQQYFEAWKASASGETDARERLWVAATIVGKVRTHLEEVVSNGKLARKQLDDLKAPPSSYGADAHIRSMVS